MMYVYIVTNKTNGTLYIGVTNNLVRRIFEHRTHSVPGFTNTYNLTRLVFFEPHETSGRAIQREKSLKRWYRTWKIDLIQKNNPDWRDLWPEIVAVGGYGVLE